MMNVKQKIDTGAYENKLDYKSNKTLYRQEEYRLETEFKNDLSIELCEMGVPEEYCAGSVVYAWSEGHSSGFNEVYNCAMDIATTIFEV